MYQRTPQNVGEIDQRATGRTASSTASQQQDRGSGAWQPQAVKEERFVRLRAEEIIGRVKTPDAKTAARNAARFYEAPPPGPGASFKDLSAYRERAVKAGLNVTADDLESYQMDLEDATQGATLMSCQAVVVDRAAAFFEPTPGAQILAQAVLRNNPKLVESLKLTNMQVRDTQESFGPPQLTKDLDPEQRLHENPERFRADMNALGKMGPMPKKPTADQIGMYRDQLRKVGVRLTLDDVKSYQKSLAEQGTHGLLKPGATNDKPLSVAMLADLHRKPATRELVGADSERFAHALAKRPQMRPQLIAQDNQRDAVQPPRVAQNVPSEALYANAPVEREGVEAAPEPVQQTNEHDAAQTAQVAQNIPQESPYAKWPPIGRDGMLGETPEPVQQIIEHDAAQTAQDAQNIPRESPYAKWRPLDDDGLLDEPYSPQTAPQQNVAQESPYAKWRPLDDDGLLDEPYSPQTAAQQNVAQESPDAQLPPLADDGLQGEANVADVAPQQGEQRAAFEMTRGGKTVALHDGYQQTGRIVAFNSGRGEVIQRVNKDETVTYKLDDFDRAMNREILEDAVRLGHDVRVNVRNGEMAVKDLSLQRDTKFIAPAMPRGETKERPSSGVYGVPIPAPQASHDAQGPTMVRDGKQQPIPNGYQQTGPVFMVSNGDVFQRIDKDTSVRYPEQDVRRALGGAEQLKTAMTYGHNVQIRVNRGELSATNQSLEKAQQREGPALHGRT